MKLFNLIKTALNNGWVHPILRNLKNRDFKDFEYLVTIDKDNFKLFWNGLFERTTIDFMSIINEDKTSLFSFLNVLFAITHKNIKSKIDFENAILDSVWYFSKALEKVPIHERFDYLIKHIKL